MRSRRSQHLDLEAAFAVRDIDLGHEFFGAGLGASADEHGGERRRPALVLELREKRHRGELDPLGQPGQHAALGELLGLRHEARAARSRCQNENARDHAGALRYEANG